jgi:hypothetical protein
VAEPFERQGGAGRRGGGHKARLNHFDLVAETQDLARKGERYQRKKNRGEAAYFLSLEGRGMR